MPNHAIVKWLRDVSDLIEETFEWNHNKGLIKVVYNIRKVCDNVTKRETLVNFVTNTVLACDGLNLLPGFSTVYGGNPEKQSIN